MLLIVSVLKLGSRSKETCKSIFTDFSFIFFLGENSTDSVKKIVKDEAL